MTTSGDQFSETVSYDRNDTSIAKTDPDLISQVKRTWQKNKKPDAQAFLAEHPSIKKNRNLVMDVAYEEYCLKREAGESIQASVFCERFPSIARSLYRQIEVDEFVRDHSDMFNVAVQPEWPGIGDQLFDFTVVEELGRGAFARAYLCSQSGVGDRQVVVKVAFKGSFEAETLGRLSHPNIMPVFSVVEDKESGTSGMCMPFFGRGTLCDVLDIAFQETTRPKSARVILEAACSSKKETDRHQQVVPPITMNPKFCYIEGICAIGLQLAEALQHGHENNIYHGDLKPSNIVLSIIGSPLIVDFNLSHDSESQVQMVGGTLPYMPPEQIRTVILGENTDPVGAECDVFSLGAILYELVTGNLPFGRPDPDSEQRELAQKMLQLQKESAPAPSKVNPDVSPRLSKLISKCLSENLHERPSSMQEVVDELQRIWQGFRKTRSRRRMLIATAAIGTPVAALIAAQRAGWLDRPPTLERAIELAKEENWDEALVELNEFIQVCKTNDESTTPALFLRGQILASRFTLTRVDSDLELALDDFQQVSRFYGAEGCWEWMGFCHLVNSDHLGAISEYSRIDNRHAALLNNMGYAYLLRAQSQKRKRRGRLKPDRSSKPSYVQSFETALDFFKQSMNMNSELFEPHCNLASLYTERRAINVELSELLNAAEIAVMLDPNQPVAMDLASRLSCEIWLVTKNKAAFDRVIRYLNLTLQLGIDIEKWFDRPPYSELPQDNPQLIALRAEPIPKREQATQRCVIRPELMFDLN